MSMEVGTPQCWAADSGLNGPLCLPAMFLLPASSSLQPQSSLWVLEPGLSTATASHPTLRSLALAQSDALAGVCG